ncbi:MAG TPA: TadE/TadG family type IV pilus assembly protein, partial [Gemmataceae bacterium]|nr:TadE/TadG family type IV pilus assembly protein [Gemmataceae bacterium]
APAPGSDRRQPGAHMLIHRRTTDTRRGAAAVELAALLPFLMFIAVIATDWARLLYYTITLETCAQNTALVLSDQTTWYQAPGNPNAATEYPTGFCQAGTPALTNDQQAVLTATARAQAPSVAQDATVTATWTTDSTNNPVVNVTVSQPFNTITNFPGVPNPGTLSRSVQMRVAPQATR